MPRGLKARLTAGVALVALIAIAMLTIGFNLLLRGNLRADADRVLSARASAALQGVDSDGGTVTAPEAVDQGSVDPGVWIYDGTRLVEGPPLGPEANALADAMAAGDAPAVSELEQQDLKMQAVPIVDETGTQIGTVIASLVIEPYERSANRALVASIVFAAVMFLLIVVMTRIVVGRALRPVAEMTSEAADWSEHDLDHRFNLGPPHDELTHLASTFDSLLARLAENLRREQRLTAEISHQLRTPLAAIAAEAELALRRPRDDVRYREALAGIERRARELAEVIETLMTAARSQSGLSGESAAANDAARRAIAAASNGGGGPPISLEPAAGDPHVQAGLAATGQILQPLLENADRYGAAPITLRVRAADETVSFEISDAGPGIAPSELEQIFDPGYRGTLAAQAPEPAGAGLGLALSRRLARALGGDLVAIPSGDGAVFRATLPLATRS
jgi:two-component system OmpR family sensor kinase